MYVQGGPLAGFLPRPGCMSGMAVRRQSVRAIVSHRRLRGLLRPFAQVMKLLLCRPCFRDAGLVFQPKDRSCQSHPSPIADSGDNRPVGGNSAWGSCGGLIVQAESQFLPGDAAHANFVATVSDSNRFEIWCFVGEFEQAMQRRGEGVNADPSHVVAVVLLVRGDQ